MTTYRTSGIPARILTELPGAVRRALSLLEESGHRAYLVGGCVRDGLLGRTPGDWDLAADALPEETAACFVSCARVIPTGVRHGTVTVLLDGVAMEITTFRVDGQYSDMRRPDSVAFTADIREDLARRDFTVNAMAYRPGEGVFDPFGGEADLRAGILRCVGEADVRFREDALRILRALRFRSQLGFHLDAAAARGVLENRRLLERVSAERITHELDKLLCGRYAAETLREYPEVFEVFIPELASGDAGALERAGYVLGHTVPVREVRLAALLGGCEGVREILTRLRYDRAAIQHVLALTENREAVIPPREREIRRWLSRLGEERLRLLLEFQKGEASRAHEAKEAEAVLNRVIASGACVTLAGLAAGGEDLLAMGLPRGPVIGRTLSHLLARVVDGDIPNTRGVLLAEARRLWNIEGGR